MVARFPPHLYGHRAWPDGFDLYPRRPQKWEGGLRRSASNMDSCSEAKAPVILIVNLNLAVDHFIEVGDLRAGEVHRAGPARRQAGGKGVNVARVLRALGEESVVAGFLGGRAGDFIAGELAREHIKYAGTPVRRESRTCIILHDPAQRRQTVINEPGPEISLPELASFAESYEELLKHSELVVVTGSLPPNLPDTIYEQLIITANRLGKAVMVDTASVPLRSALRARPLMAKINHTEATELLGRTVEDLDDAILAVDELTELGAAHAMITLGAGGAVLAYEQVKYRLAPPPVRAVNSVGSGDAVMAGLAAGWRRGNGGAALGTLATAAGAANALHGGGRCTAEEIAQLLPQVSCIAVDS